MRLFTRLVLGCISFGFLGWRGDVHFTFHCCLSGCALVLVCLDYEVVEILDNSFDLICVGLAGSKSNCAIICTYRRSQRGSLAPSWKVRVVEFIRFDLSWIIITSSSQV